MLGVSWIKFSWNLKNLSEDIPPSDKNLKITIGKKEDKENILKNLESSYRMEHAWSIGIADRLVELRRIVDEGIDHKKVDFLLIHDGPRMIGTSALYVNSKSDRQLLTGICVLDEYRCRGAGSFLLYHSLKHLVSRGLETASVVTRKNTAAAKFLYPKFDAESESVIECKTPSDFA
ncbi:MAG: GNAT family N-acetyltransferase [Verrucomicrobiota bacterium]